MAFRAERFISVIKRSSFRCFMIMSVHLLSTSALLCQDFVKITDATNPVASDPGAPDNSYTGCSWIDYNSDGLLDLFVNRKTSDRGNHPMPLPVTMTTTAISTCTSPGQLLPKDCIATTSTMAMLPRRWPAVFIFIAYELAALYKPAE